MIQQATACSHQNWLSELDPDTFRSKFNREPFKIAHRLVGHDLFSLTNLIELSKSLPADRVEYNAGDLPVSQDPARTPRNGLSIEETIERIENCRSWMVLKNVERNRRYKFLLESCLAEIRECSGGAVRGLDQMQGFIFISSPGSVTPFHIDPENNFLLQIRGRKTVWMFGPNDREVLSESQVEDFFAGAHRNLEFCESYRVRGQEIDLRPGEGLHFPVVAPHYVENGPEVSVSFSVTFQTPESADRQTLHRFNRQMRRWGLRPGNVGNSIWRDQAKLSFLRMARTAKNVVQRVRRPGPKLGHAGMFGSQAEATNM